MNVAQEKSDLRKHLLDIRNGIPEKVWSEKSSVIGKKLMELQEFQSSETIHCFVSMNARKEVNTHTLLMELTSSDKEVIVPKTNFETVMLEHSKLNSFEELKQNKWGVLEPETLTAFDSEIDLIIVPLLAADRSFNRLGYGKGFYDRFLHSSKAIKVGLLFDEFLFDEIPVEDFDEKLDILITDKKTVKRNNEGLIS